VFWVTASAIGEAIDVSLLATAWAAATDFSTWARADATINEIPLHMLA
jgi:hypothetical protein